MKQSNGFLKFLAVAVLLVGLGFYCNFAYNKVEISDYYKLKDENKALAEQTKQNEDALKARITRSVEREQKVHEAMLGLFPDKKDQIEAVYVTLAEKKAEETVVKTEETKK